VKIEKSEGEARVEVHN